MPSKADNLPRARVQFERVQFARPYTAAVAVNANALRRRPNPHQRCFAELVVREFGSGVGVLGICDVDVDGHDFWLHSQAAAIRHGWLVFIDGGSEIGAIPLCFVKTRPAAHRRHFGLLPPWEGSPPSLSNAPGHGGKID